MFYHWFGKNEVGTGRTLPCWTFSWWTFASQTYACPTFASWRLRLPGSIGRSLNVRALCTRQVAGPNCLVLLVHPNSALSDWIEEVMTLPRPFMTWVFLFAVVGWNLEKREKQYCHFYKLDLPSFCKSALFSLCYESSRAVHVQSIYRQKCPFCCQ